MRAAAATIFIFLLVTVGFIILNLQPATISIFGLVQMTQPLGVIVSIAFLGGALIAYLLIEGAGILRSWRERNRRKASKASSDADEEYHIGLEAMARGEPAAAREALERALDDDQDHVGVLFVLGNLDREAGDSEGAIQRHITANARRPGTPAILWALAEDYAQADRVDECIRALDDLLALVPDGQEALKKKRDVLETAGRFEEAIEANLALLRAGAPDDGSLTTLRLKATQGASAPKEAQAHLEAALKHDKSCMAAYMLLGEVFWRDGNAKNAVKTWERGWKATGDVTLAHRLQEAHVASGHGENALKLLRQARDAMPDEPLPALLHAQAAIGLEAFDEAERALAAEPLADHPAAALLRLELAQREGREEPISHRSMEAAAALSALHGPYVCSACGKVLEEWSAQCPACERWDTIQIAWIDKVSFPEVEDEAITEGANKNAEAASKDETEETPPS
ncbi:MAG: DUF1049 domain-containing protein [Nitrospinae bacterium]|nr:DUF1049 domain-containing protein [Nitrospinota bacterium]